MDEGEKCEGNNNGWTKHSLIPGQQRANERAESGYEREMGLLRGI